MFLMLPTVEELTHSDLPDLVDMLVRHSQEYTRLHKTEGKTPRTNAIAELIQRIQKAIELKRI